MLISYQTRLEIKGADVNNIKQHGSSYLLRLAEQEVVEMWVILHRLQQSNSSV